jgi:hypothetical protein
MGYVKRLSEANALRTSCRPMRERGCGVNEVALWHQLFPSGATFGCANPSRKALPARGTTSSTVRDTHAHPRTGPGPVVQSRRR